MNKFIAPMREKYFYFQSHREEVDKILAAGAEKARKLAQTKLAQVKNAIGM